MTDETSGSNGNHYSEDDRSVGTPDHNLRAPEAEPPTIEAEEIGGAVVGAEIAEPTKIPVNGPEGDDDTATQRWRDDNWVKDKATAEIRAYAEDASATRAAVGDRAVKALEAFPAEYSELDRQYDEMGERPQVTARWGKAKKEQRAAKADDARRRFDLVAQQEELKDKTQEALDNTLGHGISYKSNAVGLARESIVHPEARNELEELLTSMRHNIEHYRGKAEELGEWAGVLHEHPPSEAFKAAGSSLFDYDSHREMYGIEHSAVEEKKDLAAEMRDKLEGIRDAGLTFEGAESLINEIRDDYGPEEDNDKEGQDEILAAYCAETRGLVKELWHLIDTVHEDHMTIQQVKQRAIELTTRVIDIEESEAIALQRILDDVRSGKAADPNYKVEEIPTGQMSDDLAREGHWHAGQAEKWHGIAEERDGGSRDGALKTAALHAKKAQEALEAANRRDELAAGGETERPAEP